jgi:hypothetical protein
VVPDLLGDASRHAQLEPALESPAFGAAFGSRSIASVSACSCRADIELGDVGRGQAKGACGQLIEVVNRDGFPREA